MSLPQSFWDAIDRLKLYNLGIYNAVSNKFGLSGVGGMAANWRRHSTDTATVSETVAGIAESVAASDDAASASAIAAAVSAGAAASDATAAHADRLAADTAAAATAADRTAVAADKAAVHTDRLAADTAAAATAADRQAVATDKDAVHADRLLADADAQATAADRLAVAADKTAVGTLTAQAQAAAVSAASSAGETRWCGTAGGTANALILTPANPVTALFDGLRVRFRSASSNAPVTRTNLLPNPQTKSAWVTYRSSVSENADPGVLGGMTADRVVVTNGSSGDVVNVSQAAVGVAGTTYVYYDVLKAGSVTQAAVVLQTGAATYVGKYFNLSTGAIIGMVYTEPVASGIIPLANGYYLCWVAGTLSAGFTAPVGLTYLVAGGALGTALTNGTHLISDGAQLEPGTYPSPLILSGSVVDGHSRINVSGLGGVWLLDAHGNPLPQRAWAADDFVEASCLLTRGHFRLESGPGNAIGAINETAVTLASAATTDIGSAAGNAVRVSGTTTITALGTAQAGARRHLTFAAALTLTHNGTSLILPGAASIATAAGDTAEFESLGSGNWRCMEYNRAAGLPFLGSGGTVTGRVADTEIVLTGASNVYTINSLSGNNYILGSTGVITAASTLANPTNLPPAGTVHSFSIRYKQDATGGRTVSVGGSWINTGGASANTAPNKWNLILGKIYSDGTVLYGFAKGA